MKNKHKHSKIAAILIGFLLCFLCACGNKNEARTIAVEKINGTVTAKTDKKTTDVTKGEKLKSGQEISVGSSSDLTLLLDADKHIFAEENSVFNLVAKGKSGKTKTKIEMSSGKMRYDIDKKLKDEETFEVSTPNAIMSVRGTSFIVEIIGQGADATTKITVESGSIQVITEENGVERIITIGAGEQMEFEGVCPGYELKGNSGSSASVSSGAKVREGYGPEVLSITYDSKDEEVREYFKFFETYPEFTDKTLKPWILDLQGNTIELEEIWTLDTDVTIINGTVKTSKDTYILNKGKLHLGHDYSGNANMHINSFGLGIKNEGELLLRSGSFIVNDGTGIENNGTLTPEYRDSNYFDEMQKETVTVKSGNFLTNNGKALLINNDISGDTDGLVINNKDLALSKNIFTGKGKGQVINNTGARLQVSGDSFFVDSDSAVGLINYGEIVEQGGDVLFPNAYFSATYPGLLLVTKGTGLINYGKTCGYIKACISDGIGVDNHGEMFTGDSGKLIGCVEGGVLLINEEKATFVNADIYVKSGQALVNKGTFGNTQSLHITVVSDDYSGVLALNESSGTMGGAIMFKAGGLNNATLLKNLGTVNSEYLSFSTGMKILSLESWFDFTDRSATTVTFLPIFDPRVEFVPDQNVSVKDSVLFFDEGSTQTVSFAGYLCGKGSGTYELYHAKGSGTHELGMPAIGLFGSNSKGLVIDSGVNVSSGSGSFQIGIAAEGDNITMSSYWEYLYGDYEYDLELCSGNIGIENAGIYENSKDDKYVSFSGIVKGSQNKGILNTGFMKASLSFHVTGNRNVGLDNPGSIEGDSLGAVIAELGGNTGVINSGLIKNTTLRMGNTYEFPTPQDIDSKPVSAYGSDYCFINTKTGTVDSPDDTLNINTRSTKITTVVNNNYFKFGKIFINMNGGTGLFLEADSVTYTTDLNVSNDSAPGNQGGTAISLSGLLDVKAFPSSAYDSGKTPEGTVYIASYGSQATGIYIANGGSFTHLYSGTALLYACKVASYNGGYGIINEGTLHLDYPEFVSYNSEVTKALADRGIFSFEAFPDRIKDGYYQNKCPGPWYGAEYSVQ